MSTAARIDELRKKFEENPRRYFAPLANELRKAGDLVQAIALCREHLPKQPGHMSGYIVFGQALFESGALDEARSVFEQALALDPENLIALRHLGDIAKAGGDIAIARRWYERVLDADPRNDDIASQLASLAAIPIPVSVRPTPTASSAFATPPIPMPAIGLGAVPTPDASLRAVDFDVVNARIASYTPLDLDAIESAGAPDEAQTAAPKAFEAPRFGTPHSVPSVSFDAWNEPTAPPVRQPTPLDSPVLGATLTHSTPSFGTPSHGTPQAERPGFPTAPFGAPSVGVPAAGAADVHDALDAFAAHDPSDEMQGDDFGFPATAANAPSIDASADGDAVYELAEIDEPSAPFAEAFEEGIMAPEWPDTSDLVARVSSTRSITPPVVEITPEAVEAFGRESHDPEPIDVGSAHEVDDVDAAGLTELVDSDLVDSDLVDSEIADPVDEQAFASDVTIPVESVAVDESHEVFDQPLIVTAIESTELPWLAPPEAVEANDSDFALEEIAAAFASDARAVGNDGDVHVTSVESNQGVGAEVSFADVLDVHAEDEQHDADEGEADDLAAATPANESPAFVTETMAELLVSQGFIGRAATVYEELVRRHPYDPVLTSRLAELRDQLSAESSDGPAVPHSPAPASFVAIPTPVEGTASFPTPSLGTSAFGTPAFPTPAYATPAYATPAYAASAYDTPTHASPLVTPPYATPAFAAVVGGATPITARERFAQLAARRVPRRTPPQPTPVVEEPFEGLSALFGENSVPGSGDDAAARALADAFAPISEADAASSAMLDFGESDLETGADATSRTEAITMSPRPTPPTGDANAGFSFDRFFPDPATQSPPPVDAEKAPDPSAPVGDDLAQFSAWLKGLGTT